MNWYLNKNQRKEQHTVLDARKHEDTIYILMTTMEPITNICQVHVYNTEIPSRFQINKTGVSMAAAGNGECYL